MARHVTFSEAIREAADSGWGQKFETKAKAQESLLAGKIGVTEAAMLDFVRRMNAVANALAADKESERNKDIKRPSNAMTVPDAEVGMRLYYCEETESGIQEYVVVSVTEEGHLRIAPCWYMDYGWTRIEWATDCLHTTAEGALTARAKKDLEYHKPRADHAQAILRAADSGESLEAFYDGMETENT